jgi:hypothetical protein
MFGFCGRCAVVGALAIVTATGDANRTGRTFPAVLMVYLLSTMA